MTSKKYDLEDMISFFREEEVLPVGGGLSTEQIERIEKMAIDKLENETDFSKTKGTQEVADRYNIVTYKTKRGFKKRWVALAAVAVLVVGTLSVGAAKGVWNFGLVDFSGISAQNIDALDGSQSQIGDATTATLIDYSKNPDGEEVEVTFTVTDSFGDSQQQFLEITTDYPAPEGFDPVKDVITPKLWHWEAWEPNSDNNSSGGSGYEEILVKDGMLVMHVYLEEMHQSINKADMSLYFEELYLCKDAPVKANGELDRDFRNGELLLGGSWELTWTNNYETDTNVAMSEQLIVLDGIEIQVDEITVSKLGIRWEGHTTKDDLSEIEMDSVVAAMHVDYLFGENDLITIVYDDGSTIEVEHPSGLSVEKNGEVEYYVSVKEEDIVLDPEKVKSLNFHGVEILIP